MNKITILDDSIQLILFYGEEKQILKTFGKKQITYLIENDNLKVFAANDYFYRGCLWSSDIPLLINDEVYSDIPSIVEKLDEWFYSPNEGGGSGTTITVDAALSTTSTNPVQNKVITSAISGFVTSDFVDGEIEEVTSGLASTEWVEAQNYLTEHQPLKTINGEVISGTGNIVITSQTVDAYTKAETDALLDDKMDVSGMTDYAEKSDLEGLASQSWVEQQNYLTEHQPLKTINGEVISGTGNIVITSQTVDAYTKAETNALLDDKMDVSGMTDYALKTDIDDFASEDFVTSSITDAVSDIPVFQLRWVADGDNYICDNVTHTKYQQEMQQVSFDGSYWMSIGNTRRGSVIEYDSEDCGYIAPQYRWVEKVGVTACTGTSKCKVEKEQVSYDSGVTFEDVVPEVTRNGEVIEEYSTDCGFDPSNYKAMLTLDDGSKIAIPGSGGLSSSETKSYSSTTVDVEIYSSVTSIGDGAFSGFTELTNITIPDSVTIIGTYSFSRCSGLTSVTIGNGLTSIGLRAFQICSSLSSITIPNSVTSIGEGAFDKCGSLTSITIPSGVTSIENYTFSYCSGLTSIEIPDSVTNIGGGAFSQCSGLTSITIPDSVTIIGTGVFQQCTGLTSITSLAMTAPTIGQSTFRYIVTGGTLYYPSGSDYSSWLSNDQYYLGYYNWNGSPLAPDYKVRLTLNDSTTVDIPWNDNTLVSSGDIYSYRNSVVSATISDGVTNIKPSAFNSCYSLSSVTFPNSLQTIENNAFWSCSGLTEIHIPSGVTAITGNVMENPFAGCNRLSAITVDSNNAVYDSRNNCNAIIKKSNNELVTGCKNSVIPNDVVIIGERAFNGCTGLTSINLHSGITNIKLAAFSGCYNLTEFVIPNGIRHLNDNILYGCSGLTSVTIPDSVTGIGQTSLAHCESLTNITIPSGVTTISYGAFEDCYGLTSITSNASTAPSIEQDTFLNLSNGGQLYVPQGSDYSTWMRNTEYYLGYYGWIQVSSDAMGIITKTSDGSRYVISANTETTAGTLTWHEPYNCAIAHSIGQNEDVTVEILPTVTTVGDSAFTTWYGLSSIVIPSTVTTVGPSSFSQCSGLTSITCLATTAPTLDGSNVFNGISSTGTLYVPTGATGYNAWFGQNALPSGWTISYI